MIILSKVTSSTKERKLDYWKDCRKKVNHDVFFYHCFFFFFFFFFFFTLALEYHLNSHVAIVKKKNENF